MATLMKQRRGTTAEWAAANEVLPDGALGVNEDNHQFKIGDGVTPWNTLPYATLSPQVIDATGDLLVGSGPDNVVRLPRGTTGQGLVVNADGTLGWKTPSVDVPEALADAVGDLIVGTGADTFGRLARGTTGQQLTVQSDGTLAWATPAANGVPVSLIDAAGDLIVGSADNTAARLAKGANGTVLGVTAGAVGWVAPSADIPLSLIDAAGDLVVGSADNTAARLAKGANGQVLGVTAGAVGWTTPSADVPLSTVTAQGDLIVASAAGAVTRLAKGADGSQLSMVGTTLTWVDDTPTPKGVVAAMYTTGSANTPSAGTETAGLQMAAVPIVAGRRYTCRILAGLVRSDNSADQSQLRVRIGSSSTGTIIWASWFIQWSTSLIAQQQVYEFDFIGHATTTALASGTTPATVAAGFQTFNFTFTKNSGSGNVATMNLVGSANAPSVLMVRDIGL